MCKMERCTKWLCRILKFSDFNRQSSKDYFLMKVIKFKISNLSENTEGTIKTINRQQADQIEIIIYILPVHLPKKNG